MDVLGVARLRRQVRRVFNAVLDAILPLRERSARTKARSLEEIPLSPTEHELLGVRITTLMDYRQSAVQDLIRALKYDGSGYAARLAAGALADYLREEIAAARTFSPRRILIVPVPLHKSRARERGFNQIELVVRALPEEFRAMLAPHVMERVRATKPQTRLPRRERLSNLKGAFEARNVELLKKSHVFLIDDVTTTGATLLHASRPLQDAGAKVTPLALARA